MARVYVGRLPFNIHESEIYDMFRRYGHIVNIDMKSRFCFLEFDDPRDAEDAIRDMDGRSFAGEYIEVQTAKTHRFESMQPRPVFRILVENVDSRVSWQDLKDFARTVCDRVKRTEVFGDGTGIAEFPDEQDMLDAIKQLDGKELRGKVVKVVQAKDDPKYELKRDRRRSRSPDRRDRHDGDYDRRDHRREDPRDYRREDPRDYRREDPRDYRREDPRDYRREDPRDYRREDPRDYRREDPRDYRREEPREYRRDDPRDHPRDYSRERPRDRPRESSRSY